MVRETLAEFDPIAAGGAGRFCPGSREALEITARRERMVFTVAPRGRHLALLMVNDLREWRRRKARKVLLLQLPGPGCTLRFPMVRALARQYSGAKIFCPVGVCYARNRPPTHGCSSERPFRRRSSFPRQRPPVRRRKSSPPGARDGRKGGL